MSRAAFQEYGIERLNYKKILDSYRDEVADMLCELVSFKSVNAAALPGMPFGEEVHRAYLYMLERAERDGFEVFDADGFGGHIEWGGLILGASGEAEALANETLGIPVHLDVVPAGDGWTKDPWSAAASGGRIYGRGASDNKNAVCAVYYAMKALKEAGHTPSKNIRLIIGLDEETGWTGMDRYFEQAEPPDFGFAPDADFPVINGEMGLMVFEIAKKLEPARENGLYLRSVTGGSAPNMVPDSCRALLGFEDGAAERRGRGAAKNRKSAAGKSTAARDKAYDLVKTAVAAYRERTGAKVSCKGVGNALEISARGVSAHGSKPELGVNAVSIIMELLSEMPLGNESARDFVEFYHTNIGRETNGKSLGIAMSDAPSGSLIVNAGMIDLGLQAALLAVNVRYPVSKSENDVYDALRPVLDANGLGVVKIQGVDPLYRDEQDPFIMTLMDVYRENTGDAESRPIVIGGGTYARAIPGAVAFGPRFPEEEEVMHQKDEYVSADSLMKAAHIYADAIYRLAFEDKR